MAPFVYIQFVFHSASFPPLELAKYQDVIDQNHLSLSIHHIPINECDSQARVKAYRLQASDQYVLNTSYDTLDEEGDELPIINVDDIGAFPGGISYSHQHIVCFSLRISDLNTFFFKIRVTLYPLGSSLDSSDKPFICESHFSGRQLRSNSTGILYGPLLTKTNEPVGHINFDYLVTSPWPELSHFSELPLLSFPSLRRPLMIGHRGAGSSYGINPSKYLENTIDSFVIAERSGADFIELDVQLTRDKAVVVFHDFLTEAVVNIDLARSDTRSRLELPLRDLSHHQLIKNKFKHASISGHNDKSTRDTLDRNDDTCIFPLIGEVMKSLPAHVGIDIEVKFPQQDKNGSWELEGSYFDRNTVVERVLIEVFQNNVDTKRPIMFSSFDPAICIMLRQKQRHYPVFFIMSSLKSENEYMDARSRQLGTAITFCLAEKLSGLCAQIDPIVEDLSKIAKLIHQNNLFLITWGSADNSPDHISHQTNCNVDGIIFDRIYEVLPTSKLLMSEFKA